MCLCNEIQLYLQFVSVIHPCAWCVKDLITADKDHAGDPMSFVPIFHSESNQIVIFQ
jgi:hypothetical protein